LTENVSPRLATAVDLGPVDPSRSLPLLSLRFRLTAAHRAALQQLLSDQQNPASPAFHQWLTPEQFAARFGLAPQDLATISSWLAAQGFSVISVARGGLFLQFSGTAGQVNRAFHTELHSVLANGEHHISNLSAPSLPSSIAAVTAAITGLDDFTPRAHVREQVIPADSNSTVAAHPEYTSSTGSHNLAPGDFYTIYDENPLLKSGINGTGISIAVLGQTDIYPADIAAFQAASGLASNPPAVMLNGTDPGYTNSTDLLEAEMVLEWAGAAAPGASILYINSANAINGSLTLAIDNNLAPIIADGYGQCEPSLGASAIVYYDQMLQMAAAEGITIVTTAGNDGATGCDTNDASASVGPAVDFPSSSPYVTGVGGTEFNEGSGSYFASTNGTYSGSALSYIPEKAWNDDSSSGLAAGGGGASAYFSKPSWQIGHGVPADFSRDVPDVSLSASIAHDGYLICTTGYCASGYQNASGALDVAGGTSASMAGFAGLMALVEQKTGARLGVANPVLYALANSSYAGSVFHDVTTGANASPCTSGSLGCGSSGSIGFAATAGYDQATGWGSVDAASLVNDWALVTPLVTTGGTTATTTNLAASASPVSAGTAVTLSATVASAVSTNNAAPTGSVQFTVDGVASGPAVALAAGAATYALNTSSLSVGNHTIQATYSGDSNYAGSKGAFLLAITTPPPAFSLTPATVTVTTAAGTIAPGVLFTVTGLNGFSGNVQFTASTPVTLAAQYSFSVNPVALSSTAPSGTTLLELLAYTTPALAPHTLGPTAAAASPTPSIWRPASAITLAGLLLLIIPRRRRLGGLLSAVIACAALGLGLSFALGLSGCGGPAPPPSSNSTNIPTPAGTYTVTIAATATVGGVTATQSSTVTFVVQ
jgi:subtilase family serine protease